MKVEITDRGFEVINHPIYPEGRSERLVQQSSTIEGGEKAWNNPGTSFLWIGNDHHLNRKEVWELIVRLRSWYDRGTLMTMDELHKEVKKLCATDGQL